jgi:hypothetical protein
MKGTAVLAKYYVFTELFHYRPAADKFIRLLELFPLASILFYMHVHISNMRRRHVKFNTFNITILRLVSNLTVPVDV